MIDYLHALICLSAIIADYRYVARHLSLYYTQLVTVYLFIPPLLLFQYA